MYKCPILTDDSCISSKLNTHAVQNIISDENFRIQGGCTIVLLDFKCLKAHKGHYYF